MASATSPFFPQDLGAWPGILRDAIPTLPFTFISPKRDTPVFSKTPVNGVRLPAAYKFAFRD